MLLHLTSLNIAILMNTWCADRKRERERERERVDLLFKVPQRNLI